LGPINPLSPLSGVLLFVVNTGSVVGNGNKYVIARIECCKRNGLVRVFLFQSGFRAIQCRGAMQLRMMCIKGSVSWSMVFFIELGIGAMRYKIHLFTQLFRQVAFRR
jgi:hypothetical protein